MNPFAPHPWDDLSIIPRILLPAVLVGGVVAGLSYVIDLPTRVALAAVIAAMAVAVWIGLHRFVKLPLSNVQS